MMYLIRVYPGANILRSHDFKRETLEGADKVLTAFADVPSTSIFVSKDHDRIASLHNYDTIHEFNMEGVT